MFPEWHSNSCRFSAQTRGLARTLAITPSACGAGFVRLLKVRSDGTVEHFGEGVPSGSHPDRNGQRHGRKDERRGPHGGAVDAAEGQEFVSDKDEKQDAESGDGASGGWESDA